MEKINYIGLSKEISFNALKKGNINVMWTSKNIETDNGFDIVSHEGNKKEYIGVKATVDTDIFNITEKELRIMKNFSDKEDSDYVIHRYRFNEGKVEKFNIYEYDKERNVLVDVIDDTNICTITPITGVAQYACTPKKITKKYELK